MFVDRSTFFIQNKTWKLERAVQMNLVYFIIIVANVFLLLLF